MPIDVNRENSDSTTPIFNGRLRLRFLSWISIILVITLGGATYYIYNTQQTHLEYSLKNKAYAMGQFIALISPDAIYSYDVTTLDSFVEQISNDVDIRYAQIVTPENVPITTYLPEDIDPNTIAKWISDNPGFVDFESSRDTRSIALKFPINDGEINLGWLVIGLNTARIEYITQTATVFLIEIYTIIVLILGAVIFIVFKMQVLNPVNALTTGATRVADGQLDQDVPIISHDELGRLAHSFNMMQREIKNDREILIGFNKQLEEEIEYRHRASEELKKLSMAVEQSPASVVITDTTGLIEYVNPKFSEISGYSAKEVIGNPSKRLGADVKDSALLKDIWNSLEKGKIWKGEFSTKRKNGTVYWESAVIAPIRDNNNITTHYLTVKEDITQRKAIEDKLLEQATHDQLTKLPNRFLAFDRLEQLIQHADRNKSHIAVIYIDLDNFKNVNDSLGHSVGDELLILISKRISDQLRKQDTLARLGGDEFLALIPDLHDLSTDLEKVVTRLLSTTESPVELHNHQLNISSSLGIAVYPEDGTTVSSLMSNADIAMYDAKHAGRNTFRFFTNDLNNKISEKMALETELSQALELNELYPVYQPILDISNHELVGAEVLLRWNNPQLGIVPPSEFIPIAEQSGLIRPITDWLFQRILEDTNTWNSRPDNFWLSVNVPPNYFCDTSFSKAITRINQQAENAGIRLCIEITENLLLQGDSNVLDTFEHLNNLGIESAIDDFGTGYSSLAYIKKFPLNHLKIDRSFVEGLPYDEDDRALTEIIVLMSKKFGISVIAEGVENEEQADFLHSLDIKYAQGFLYAKPMVSESFNKYLFECYSTELTT
ncbi:MAG: EAL domain-containing protein [Candidatus Thiodiazotropha taylori]|nr:EAL domain-containing protein [Candidatus Thiodiazotropha taylori]MCG8113727.1 EAL domain-containing protein [Candidatus Thiodiazotropha taylori]MCW4286087.1 EAL domain-containing protein [Candidatus Thiodiazotropha taylori]MCW4306026.1 EAL domain-containing protein [Candidatus Thiodiazotropha taylori]